MASEYIEGRKAAKSSLGDVLVLGLGSSGRDVCSYCLDLLGTRVSSLTVAAGERTDESYRFAQAATARGAKVVFDTYTFEDAYDVCIASPGISQFSRFYENAQAASGEVISEVEFAWRESRADSKWVAITGTNGKTTTTSLINEILQAGGVNAAPVGNIGTTCIGRVAADTTDVYVAETSSFQLASMVDFAPDVAVLLNITPDHIYWHMTFEAYVQAKKNIYRNLGKTGGVLVIDAVCDTTRNLIKEFRNDSDRGFSYIPMGCAAGLDHSMRDACGSDNAAFLDGQMLRVDYDGKTYELVAADELNIKGEHNVGNALAAASAALVMGVDVDDVRRALRAFQPLEHRLEPCGEVNGVACYNDSKATNVDATLKALGSFPGAKPVFLLGGHDKGTDLKPLVELAEQKCKAVVCFGAAGQRFADAFKDSSLSCTLVPHMEDALDTALAMCQPGDIVVLSPACSSFDEFDSFEHRGTVFKQLVKFRSQQSSAE